MTAQIDWKLDGFPFTTATQIHLKDGSSASVEPYSYQQSRLPGIKRERQKKDLRVYRVKCAGEPDTTVKLYDEFELVELIGEEEFRRVGGTP